MNYLSVFQSVELKAEGKKLLKSNKGFFELKISKEDFDHVKINSHELCINKSYYEFKILQKTDSSVSLLIHFDKKETKFERLKEQQNKVPKKQIKTYGFQLYFEGIADFKKNKFEFQSNRYFPTYLGELVNFQAFILDPPRISFL